MSAEELEEAWRSLSTPETPQQLAATGLPGNDIWAAVDFEGQRHLLLRLPPGTEAPETATRGLRVSVARHQVAGGSPADYLDLLCLSPAASVTFTSVAADIASHAGPAAEGDRLNAVVDALARWQWFWGVEGDRLSEHDALGLFAELWFLRRWEGARALGLRGWTASSGSRHDFQWPERSVEVKAATRRADGSVHHQIQHLDQLSDPEEGQLFLFSLRVVRDELAHNTLPALIDQIEQLLAGDVVARDEFSRKLGERGYNPAYRQRHETPYRVLGEQLYRVADRFPRLTASSFPAGLPPGIGEVSYVLDMGACDEWTVASTPDEWEPSA